MDWLTLLGYIPLVIRSAETIKSIIDAADNNESIVSNIKSLAPAAASLLENIGGTLFPKAKPALRIAAGAMASFDPNITKWLQQTLNDYLPELSQKLAVDGIYGPKTRDAVEMAQTKLGLVVDGWAGTITRSALDFALGQQPVIK